MVICTLCNLNWNYYLLPVHVYLFPFFYYLLLHIPGYHRWHTYMCTYIHVCVSICTYMGAPIYIFSSFSFQIPDHDHPRLFKSSSIYRGTVLYLPNAICFTNPGSVSHKHRSLFPFSQSFVVCQRLESSTGALSHLI